MGKEGNIPLKNQLVMMKSRMVKQLSKQMNKEKDWGLQIREHLEHKDFESAIQLATSMTREYFGNDMTNDLEKKVSHLINLCGDLRGKYSLGQIKSNKMAVAPQAAEAKLDQDL